ncbi:MAG TPA: hypothetical protein DEP84_13935 [Chloroflexi bacterium]|nr:hypothetical protein [Chloroflexota bacterium]
MTAPLAGRAPASRLLLVPFLLLSFALRAYHLDFQSFWSDEGISLLRASEPLGEMLRTMPVEHAPGYFVLLHFWLRLTGESDFAVRFLSLSPSVLAVVLAYRLAADLGNRRAGLIAALLLATNTFQVWYAQEARMYSWLLATSLGSVWLLWLMLRTTAGRLRPAVYGLGYTSLTAATIYLHHYGFLVPLTHAVFVPVWLWHNRTAAKRRVPLHRGMRWVIAAAATGLLYLPWLPHSLGIFGFPGWRAPLDPRQLPWRYLTAYTVGDPMPAPWHAWLSGLYLVLALVGAAGWGRRQRTAGLLLVLSVLVPLAAAIVLAVRQPDFHERYTIMISAPLLLLVGGAVGVQGLDRSGQAPTRKRRPAIHNVSVALLLAGLVGANGLALQRLYTDSRLHKPDFRGAARRVEALEAPGDVVLVDGPDPQKVFLHYYHGRAPVHDLRSLQGVSTDDLDAALTAATAGAQRVWGLRYFHEPGPVQRWLALHGWPTTASAHNGIALTLYGLPGDHVIERPVGIAFGPGVTLTKTEVGGSGSDGDAIALHAGDLLRVTSRWDVTGPLPGRKFSLRLQDAAGRVWLAEDYIPQDGFAPTEYWPPGEPALDQRGLLLPPDLPSGRYLVTLRLYDPATGTAVETVAGQDVPLMPVDLLPAVGSPDPATLLIATRLNRALSDDLTLLGFEVTPRRLRPGHEGSLTLWWRADRQPAQPYRLRIELLKRQEEAIAKQVVPLSLAPTDAWQPGQIVRERYPLVLDPAATSGAYALSLTLADLAGQPVGTPLTLGNVPVQARARSYRLPRGSRPLDAHLGEAIALRGYNLRLPQESGDDLVLTLYWQAQQHAPTGYKVFVHLVDDAGQIAAQSDAFPDKGEAPTESWLPNEVVVDRHTLRAPGSGHYRLLVGMYDPISGQRLPARDQAHGPLPESAIPLEEVALP